MDQERLRLSQVALKVRRVMGLISAVLALLLASVAVYLAYRVFDQELTPWLLIEPGMMLVCSAFVGVLKGYRNEDWYDHFFG